MARGGGAAPTEQLVVDTSSAPMIVKTHYRCPPRLSCGVAGSGLTLPARAGRVVRGDQHGSRCSATRRGCRRPGRGRGRGARKLSALRAPMGTLHAGRGAGVHVLRRKVRHQGTRVLPRSRGARRHADCACSAEAGEDTGESPARLSGGRAADAGRRMPTRARPSTTTAATSPAGGLRSRLGTWKTLPRTTWRCRAPAMSVLLRIWRGRYGRARGRVCARPCMLCNGGRLRARCSVSRSSPSAP